MKVLPFVLFTSAILAPSVSWGDIYLYHLCAFITLIFIVYKNELKSFLEFNWKNQKLWIALCAYSLLSITWSPETFQAVKYNGYILSGVFLIFTLPYFFKTRELRLKAEKLLFYLILIHISLSFIEILTPFRWPISAYSPLSSFFGKEKIEYFPFFEHYPTSFFWHQNNCALFSLISLPFLLQSGNKYKVVFATLSFFIIYFCGSKSIFLLACLYLAYILAQTFVMNTLKLKQLAVLMAAFISLSLVAYKLSNIEQKNELTQSLSTLEAYVVPMISFFVAEIKGEPFDFGKLHKNIRERYYFMDGAIKLYQQSPLLGAGAGAHLEKEIFIDDFKVKLRSLHNYWLEVFIVFGPLFFLIYVCWIISLVYKTRRTKYSEALILFSLGVPVLSSAIYFLPQWLLCALAQSYVNNEEPK